MAFLSRLASRFRKRSRLSKLSKEPSFSQRTSFSHRNSSFSRCDLTDVEDEPIDECHVPSDVPQGFLAIYVGSERRRFIIEAGRLNHPVFKILLERTADEYGFAYGGALAIPCEVVLFEHLLWLLNNGGGPTQDFEVNELLDFYCS